MNDTSEAVHRIFETLAAQNEAKAERRKHYSDKEKYEACYYVRFLGLARKHGVSAPFDIFDDFEKAVPYIAGAKFVLLQGKSWEKINKNDRYSSIFDPVTDFDVVQDGYVGRLLGCKIFTDVFLPPNIRCEDLDLKDVAIFVNDDEAPSYTESELAELKAASGYHTRIVEALSTGEFIPESEYVFEDLGRVLSILGRSKYALIHSSDWCSIIATEALWHFFDCSCNKHNGFLGTIAGCEIYTDAFLPLALKDTSAAGKAVFVPRENYTEQEEADIRDRAILSDCHFTRRLPYAMEHGILTHVDIFNGKHNRQLKEMLQKSKYALIPNSAWSHIIGSNNFATMHDPITKYDFALNGSLGQLDGCQLYTDSFLPPHLKDQSDEAKTRVIFVPRDSE